ncbi:MAG: archease [Thermoguttaceae bacterium]
MFETFEHTADVGLRIRAADLDGLFADAGRGLFSLIVANPEEVSAIEELPVALEGAESDALLHDWLAELLYLSQVRRLLFSQFDVHVRSDRLEAKIRGQRIDPHRHRLDLEVKAITWHGLKVERTADGWLAEVIVDI